LKVVQADAHWNPNFGFLWVEVDLKSKPRKILLEGIVAENIDLGF
jgi:hypothetical protein